MDELIQGVTNDVYLRGYNVRRTSQAIVDAILAVTIYDQAGKSVSGADALPLSYDASSHEYYASIPAAAGLVAGSTYRVRVEASNYDDIFEVVVGCVSPGGTR